MDSEFSTAVAARSPTTSKSAHDQFADFCESGAIGFFPNGLTWELKNGESIRGFYELLCRQTIKFGGSMRVPFATSATYKLMVRPSFYSEN
jgi:hypothetical protein